MLNNYDVFEDKENNVFQVRTKGDVFLVRFESEEKKQIFFEITTLTRNTSIAYKDLLKKLKKKHPEAKILSVIQELKQSGILSEHYLNPKEVKKGLSLQLLNGESHFSRIQTAKTLEIIGSGELLEVFKRTINKGDFGKVFFSDHTDKKLERIIDQALGRADLVILENNEWNPNALRYVNQAALKGNTAWMLVRGMWSGKGSLGPLFYGKETGCYDCLSARIKSNIDYLDYHTSYENYLVETNKAGKPDWMPTGFDQIIASMALFDALKFLSEWDVPETYGHLINITPSLQIEKHKLLKNPLCKTCRPKLEYNLSPWVDYIALEN